jgi:hypothetical protein
MNYIKLNFILKKIIDNCISMCAKLDWGNHLEFFSEMFPHGFDIICGSDIVYPIHLYFIIIFNF